MPHLDFRQVFESPADRDSTVVDAGGAPASNLDDATTRKQKRTLATRLPRLHRSDRTTILFATLIFVGGLFCAFYFFNGIEDLRAAAAWSREFLYKRPAAPAATDDKIGDSQAPEGVAQKLVKNSRKPQKSESQGNSTAPFGRSLGSLYPGNTSPAGATASLPAVSLPSDPGSLLNQLSLPALNGGTLAQTFDRAVADIARVASLYANAPLKLVKAPPSPTSLKRNAQVRKTGARATQNVVTHAAAAQKNVPNTQQQTRRTADLASLETPTTVISAGDVQRGTQGVGSGLGGLGGIGGLGSHGGLGGNTGGMGGGVGGAVGGALGGLGSGK